MRKFDRMPTMVPAVDESEGTRKVFVGCPGPAVGRVVFSGVSMLLDRCAYWKDLSDAVAISALVESLQMLAGSMSGFTPPGEPNLMRNISTRERRRLFPRSREPKNEVYPSSQVMHALQRANNRRVRWPCE